MEQEVEGSLALMEGPFEAESVVSTSAQLRGQTQKASHKELQFDARYGWTYDQYFDPVELAYSGGRGRFAIGPLLAASFHLTVAMIAVLDEVSSNYAVQGLKYTRKAGKGFVASRLHTSKTPVSKRHPKRKGLQTPDNIPVQSLQEKEAASLLVGSEGLQQDGNELPEVIQPNVEETVRAEAEAREQQELLHGNERDLLNAHSAETRRDEETAQQSIFEKPGAEVQQVVEKGQALKIAKGLENEQSIDSSRTETLEANTASSRVTKNSEHSQARLDSVASGRTSSAQGLIGSVKGPVQIAEETSAVELRQESGFRSLDEAVSVSGSNEEPKLTAPFNSALSLTNSQRKQGSELKARKLKQERSTGSSEGVRSEECQVLEAARNTSGGAKDPSLLRKRDSGREQEAAEVAPVTIWNITEGFDRRSLKMLAKQSAAGQGEKYQRRKPSGETRGVEQRHNGRRFRLSEVQRRASREQSSNSSELESLSMSH